MDFEWSFWIEWGRERLLWLLAGHLLVSQVSRLFVEKVCMDLLHSREFLWVSVYTCQFGGGKEEVADQGGSGLHTCCYRSPFSSIFRDTSGFPCVVSYVSLTLLTAFVSAIDCTDTGCFFL